MQRIEGCGLSHHRLKPVAKQRMQSSPLDRPPSRDLRMRFSRLAPVRVIELLGPAARDRERGPIFAGVDAGDLNDLADVVARMAQRALDGQGDGMRLAADQYCLGEVVALESVERGQQRGPTALPIFQYFRPAGECVHELVVSITPGFFSIGLEKI